MTFYYQLAYAHLPLMAFPLILVFNEIFLRIVNYIVSMLSFIEHFILVNNDGRVFGHQHSELGEQ